jgi:hypothetical protein
VYISTGDQPLKRLREPDRWTSLVQACPLHAHWLDGDPITEVTTMSGILDRHRRLVIDGQPVATGIALLADAWACTNPSQGRGGHPRAAARSTSAGRATNPPGRSAHLLGGMGS